MHVTVFVSETRATKEFFFNGYFYFLVLSNMAMAAHALWPVQVEMGLNFLLFGLLIMV